MSEHAAPERIAPAPGGGPHGEGVARISLAGTWQIRRDDEADWRPIAVPGCWDALDGAKTDAGPFWYRAALTIPASAAGRHIRLELGAVSYACDILLDGRPVGAHLGMWDSFSVDLTGLATPGATHELLIKVEKPAGLTAGPDSASLPGRFPLRTTLSGFLPYVWGQIFGGIWQDVCLVIEGPASVAILDLRTGSDGALGVDLALSGPPAPIDLTVLDPDGALVCKAQLQPTAAGPLSAALQIPRPRPWSPSSPALYTLRATCAGQAWERRFGLRTIATSGSDILLNGAPVYPRMILSWGWYEHQLTCNPSPEQVRADMQKLQALGYNGVKLCLWFPPRHYFEIADELGMLLWVELPMWLPQPDDHFRAQVSVEYERLVRQAAQHPSVLLYSLGCELSRAVGPEILAPLYAMVKALGHGALVRDNSGSGEAYGGLLDEHADYYDYHFYAELQHFRPLLDHFTPRWRPLQPWVFGEFCDLDTFRDIGRLQRADPPLWWLSGDPAVNPQGARWQFDTPFLADRLQQNGLAERGAQLEALSHQHALLHRKWTLEAVRLYREIGGYVITGESDTPISTAGMWDEDGVLKFDPPAFRAFNDDLVALVGWGKRRAWVDGGDRAAYYDPWSYRSGMVIRPHLVASNYSAASGPSHAVWQLLLADGTQAAAGEVRGPVLRPGDLREVGVAELIAPPVSRPQRAILRVTLRVGEATTRNEWPIWIFPADPWGGRSRPLVLDPRAVLAGGERWLGKNTTGRQRSWRGRTVIGTVWSPDLEAHVRAGGRAVLLCGNEGDPSPLPLAAMPFWREALRVCEPHPAWRDFPHDGWAALQFLACATDRALDLGGHPEATPILRRVDARTAATHAYIADLPLGQGHVIVTTLRLAGGQGDQPTGIANSPAALHLLACLAASP